MSSSRVAGMPHGGESHQAGWLPYTRIRARCEEIRLHLQADSAGSTGIAEIEHADRVQLALLDAADGDQVALAGCIGWAGAGWRVAAADQHRLPAQQARGIVLADAELGQVLQGGLDGEQQPQQSLLAALSGRGLEGLEGDGLRLVERGDAD